MAFMLAMLMALFGVIGNQENLQKGDEQPAVLAEVGRPESLAIFKSILYISNEGGEIQRVDLESGKISTLHFKEYQSLTQGMVADSLGNLIICQYGANVYKIDVQAASIVRIAGGNGIGFSGDGGPAIEARLSDPWNPTFDRKGNLYFVDAGNHRIRKVDTHGIITSIAGNGKAETSGDGGPAIRAGLEYPNSVAVDGDGNILISQFNNDSNSHRIRRIDAHTGLIHTIAGPGGAGLYGDGGPALSAQLQSPMNIMFDLHRNILIIDCVNDRIRRIDARTHIINTIVGTSKGFSGDGGAAINAKLNNPRSIVLDLKGNLYIADGDNHRVRRVDGVTGKITTVAGNGHGYVLMMM
jgi:trimeric autotransporter adhesin